MPEVLKKIRIQKVRKLKIQENTEKPGELEEISTNNKQLAEKDKISTEEDKEQYNTIQKITIKKLYYYIYQIIYTEIYCQKHIKYKINNNWFLSKLY